MLLCLCLLIHNSSGAFARNRPRSAHFFTICILFSNQNNFLLDVGVLILSWIPSLFRHAIRQGTEVKRMELSPRGSPFHMDPTVQPVLRLTLFGHWIHRTIYDGCSACMWLQVFEGQTSGTSCDEILVGGSGVYDSMSSNCRLREISSTRRV